MAVASAALEEVNAVVAVERNEIGPVPSGNPAVGTKQISPERLAEIQAALKREARLIGYGFLLQHLKAEFVLPLLRVRFAVLLARAYLKRFLDKLIARVGHRTPRSSRFEG